MTVNIKLWDTGYVNPEYSISETPFPTYNNATVSQKEKGEFKAMDTGIIIKVESINFGQDRNLKSIPSTFRNKVKAINQSINPFKLSMTGWIAKPADLSTYDFLLLAGMSNGHKDLAIVDSLNNNNEIDYTLYWLSYRFGKLESGMADDFRHLNVQTSGISYNESIKDLTVNLELTVFPYYH